MRIVFISLLAFLFASSTATAARPDPSQIEYRKGAPAVSAPLSSDGAQGSTSVRTSPERGEFQRPLDHMMSSSTVTSSTTNGRPPVRKVDKVMGRSVPGMVTSISTNAFTMTLPGGGDRASTSVVVSFSSSTKFMQGSTTATVSAITVGSRVEVFGKTSVSAKTITAERVIVLPTRPETRPENAKEGKQDVYSRVKNTIFGNSEKTPRNSAESNTEAAAIQGGGSIGTFFRAFLNLF